MISQTMRSYLPLSITLLVLILIQSCGSGQVTKRNRKGHLVVPKDARFNPVKKKIALLMFFNETPIGGDDLTLTATEELRLELSRTQEYVVSPSAHQIFGTSKEIYAGGGLKLNQMAKRGKALGLNFVLYGRITDARVREKADEIGLIKKTRSFTQNKIEIRMFDVNNQKEIFSEVIPGYADDSSYRFFATSNREQQQMRQELLRYGIKVTIRNAIPKLLEVAQKLEWVGRVAKIVGTKIYLNAGRESGLNLGDVLKVMTEGEEIYDPETGALIGISKGEIKGTLEIMDYYGEDGAVCMLHSGGQVVEGDYVMLY